MRAIKFRAWDKKRKCWLWECGTLDKPASTGNAGGNWELSLKTNVLLQQYTGLNDKNGKEIYEGDILKLTSIYFLFYDLFTVGFNKGSFTFKNKEEHYFKNYIGNRKEDLIIEVIGNIYENKDLIK